MLINLFAVTALNVLELMKRDYRIDEQRIYLKGAMGVTAAFCLSQRKAISMTRPQPGTLITKEMRGVGQVLNLAFTHILAGWLPRQILEFQPTAPERLPAGIAITITREKTA